jgi:glycosyltransferase involved in cell wall biosynthesis
MTQRIRVLLVIPHLGGGGAEQVTALLARGLSRERYEVHLGLVTQDDAGAPKLPSWVTTHPLCARRVRAGALRLLRLIRGLRPDVIISGMAHLNFLVLLMRPFLPRGTRVLVRQNSTVSAALDFGGLPRYTRLLYRLLYQHADRVICQSHAMAEDLARELDMECGRIAVLPNPVDMEGVLAASDGPDLWLGPGPHLLAVGRLSREKGFDLLLDALAMVRTRFPSADLILAGAGLEEAALKVQCHQLGLASAVRFVGHVDPPYIYFPGASVFVLPSRHEGMPNALLEAAVGGLPIVALPCSGGVVDLLSEFHGTRLAPEISADAFAATLLETLEGLHAGQRFWRTLRSPHVVPTHSNALFKAQEKDEFGVDRAIGSYEELIDRTCGLRHA